MTLFASTQTLFEQFGGFKYDFPDGSEVWSKEEMTVDDLQEHWEWIQAHKDQIEVYSDPGYTPVF